MTFFYFITDAGGDIIIYINIIIISIEEEQGPTRTARGGGLEFICPRTSYFILSHPGPVLQFAVGVRPNEDPSRDLKKTLEEK